MTPLAYTVEETAKALRVGRNRVYDMVACGELPALRIGRSIRVPADALNTWIKTHTEGTQHGNNR